MKTHPFAKPTVVTEDSGIAGRRALIGEEKERARVLRWLLPAALIALLPKCVLCLLAYFGAGTALGIGASAWCRATDDAPVSWHAVLALCGVGIFFVSGAIGFVASYRRERRRTPPFLPLEKR